ncbi:MAG TPA: isochorismatase family cysteine hydrolase [Anaerolineae bacterium]|nr:isochorismatase family cysteine hydrolase [Anaerolineae bacterium]
MQPTTVSEPIRERILKRRGRMRVFNDLEPSKMALVIVDMQNVFCQPGGALEIAASRDTADNINRLADVCRAANIPVIWIRSYHPAGGADWKMFFDYFISPERGKMAAEQLQEDNPGSAIYSEMRVAPSDYIVSKNRYSCFVPGSSSLERLLRSLKRDTIIICGTRSNVCCESTTRDAMMLDFKVLFVSDGTSAMSDYEHQATLDTLAQSFADVMTTDEVIQEVVRR